MSDDFMKSALDRAMERADKIVVPEEKLKEMKFSAKGEELAAALMKDPKFNLNEQLEKLDSESQQYVTKKVMGTLLQNVILPKKESDNIRNQEMFKILANLKKDQNALGQAAEQLSNLSNYYTQAVQQNYEQLKNQVEQAMANAIRQKTGAPPPGKINVENSPEFAENWRQLIARLDSQYNEAIAKLKQQIIEMP